MKDEGGATVGRDLGLLQLFSPQQAAATKAAAGCRSPTASPLDATKGCAKRVLGHVAPPGVIALAGFVGAQIYVAALLKGDLGKTGIEKQMRNFV